MQNNALSWDLNSFSVARVDEDDGTATFYVSPDDLLKLQGILRAEGYSCEVVEQLADTVEVVSDVPSAILPQTQRKYLPRPRGLRG